MSKLRAFSSPELAPMSDGNGETSSLEGVASNVMVLLKLIQEQNKAAIEENNGRSTQRVAGMLAILDDVRNRIEKAQNSIGKKKKKEAELRRCNTELRRSNIPPQGMRSPDAAGDEKARLRKELMASLAAKKSMEIMCSSLGKEKEIMATELSRKVGEVAGLEELVNDLKAQNASLLAKVQTCAAVHKDKKSAGAERVPEPAGNNAAALQERNRTLSDQLLKSLDGYRTLKRKLKDMQAENAELRRTIEDMKMEVNAGLKQIREYQQNMAVVGEQHKIGEDEISSIENLFENLRMKVSKHQPKKRECVKSESEINTSKPTSVLA
uniref:Uncharacterized protein n=1 Tax=Kalanchoe fedtschenkoi TaxID=63787 RepID=A0A7N0V9V4_KALFE